MNLSKGEQISLPPNVSLPVYLSGQNGDEIFEGPHNLLNLVVTGMDLNNIPSGCHGLSEAGKNSKLAYFYESCLKYNLSNKYPAVNNTSYNLTPAMPILARTYNSTNNFGQGMHMETSTISLGERFTITYRIAINKPINSSPQTTEAEAPLTPRPLAENLIPSTLGSTAGCRHANLCPIPGVCYDIGKAQPGWANVPGSSDPRVVEGTVWSSFMSLMDNPYSHDAHDLNFDVQLDKNYYSLNSDMNKIAKLANGQSVRLMEMEWDRGATHTVEGPSTVHFPIDFWPVTGDRVWVWGRHVFDCGEPMGSAGDQYRTEIHPAIALATSRLEPIIFNGDTALSMTEVTHFYLHGQGGVFNAEDSIPLRRNYGFDITLPPKPSANAQLKTEVLRNYYGGPDPTFIPMPGLNPPRVHVTIPLATPAGDIHYAFTWDAFTSDPSAGLAAEKDHILNYLIQTLEMKWIDPANTLVTFMNAQGFDDHREVPTIVIRGLPTPESFGFDLYDIVLTCDGSRTSNTAYATLFSTSPPGSTVARAVTFPENGGNLRLPSPNVPGFEHSFIAGPFQYTHFFQAFKTPNGQFRLYDYNPQDQSNLQYGVSIAAGWREPITSKAYHFFGIGFNSIGIRNDHAITSRLPNNPSEWHLWLRAGPIWNDETWAASDQFGDATPLSERDLRTGMDIPLAVAHRGLIVPADPVQGNFTIQSSGWQSGDIDTILGVRPTYKDWDPIDDYLGGNVDEVPPAMNIAIGNIGIKYTYDPLKASFVDAIRGTPAIGQHPACSEHNPEEKGYDNPPHFDTNCDFILYYTIDRLTVFPAGSIINTNLNAGSFLENWGSFGTSPGQFGNNSAYHAVGPFNVAFDPSDPIDGPVLYVTDPANNRIQKFNAAGTFIREWGKAGSGDADMNHPFGVAVNPITHDVYVTDDDHHRIQQFTDAGAFIRNWGTYCNIQTGQDCNINAPGARALGDGQFDHPEGIAVDPSGKFVYVADDNKHIQKFTSDGQFVMKFGSAGVNDSQFYSVPKGLAVDSSGNIYVADTFKFRIQKFDRNGNFIMKWGSGQPGSGDGEFGLAKEDSGGPHGISIDNKTGNVYIADPGNSRIQVFTQLGEFLWKTGSPGPSGGQFDQPLGIYVSPFGAAYVADSNNGRIQAFVAYH
jgi:DNA-binding beta-propeller fold protein YncE